MHRDNEGKMDNDRRKRIHRIKIAIILIVIFLLILPTICCVLLGFQVNRLQKQVNQLAEINGLSDRSEKEDTDKYVYAAVKPNSEAEDETVATVTPAAINSNAIVTLEPKHDMTAEGDSSKDTVINDNDNKDIINAETKTDVYAGKKVYLTFDDGPSKYTGKILDTLKKYKVNATFFVIGKTDKESKKIYNRIIDEGHTLGMHSYSHIYNKIYQTVEDFDKDFTKLWKLLYDTTGYKPSIYRFPGGSDNLVNKNGMDKFINYLNEKSIVYFDWNVVNGDATSIDYTKAQLIDNVLDGVAIKERSIVLMHDAQTKKMTAESLPELLEDLIAGGAQILPLDKDVKPIQMIKVSSIK